MTNKSLESRLSDTVGEIYAAAISGDRWPMALHGIASATGDVGAVLVYAREGGGYGTIVSPGLEAAQRDYIEKGWWKQDVRMQRGLERGYIIRNDTVTERHLFDGDEIADMPFYTEFLAAHGLGWHAGTMISPHPSLPVAVSVQRAADRPPYTDEELDTVNRLARHVENALRIGIRLIDAEVASVTLADILTRLNVGVFLIDDSMRIVFANGAGRNLLEKRLLIGDPYLAAPSDPERGLLISAIQGVLNSGPGDRQALMSPLAIRSGDGSVAMYVLPVVLPERHPVDHALATAKVIVVAIEASVEAADPAVLRDLLGLTLGEARVASMIGAGLKPRMAADRLGISEETARTVLKRVFAKTGISHQGELAGLLTRLTLR